MRPPVLPQAAAVLVTGSELSSRHHLRRRRPSLPSPLLSRDSLPRIFHPLKLTELCSSPSAAPPLSSSLRGLLPVTVFLTHVGRRRGWRRVLFPQWGPERFCSYVRGHPKLQDPRVRPREGQELNRNAWRFPQSDRFRSPLRSVEDSAAGSRHLSPPPRRRRRMRTESPFAVAGNRHWRLQSLAQTSTVSLTMLALSRDKQGLE